ncbi:hypothetical protein OBBRIDRAFT_835368 [Obba rivulosa]|uniref:Uncharacterized protein n=1 Tax=Obba rivulosa TaxID=1052685 RepID=A0A8E2AVL4_9APHY|nr:hypothetical protein OBBRIDRAFT_835368 [Obba rivulosa]
MATTAPHPTGLSRRRGGGASYHSASRRPPGPSRVAPQHSRLLAWDGKRKARGGPTQGSRPPSRSTPPMLITHSDAPAPADPMYLGTAEGLLRPLPPPPALVAGARGVRPRASRARFVLRPMIQRPARARRRSGTSPGSADEPPVL